MTDRTVPEVADLQTRTVQTLMGSQMLGGVGVASGIAVAALMAAEISGRDDLSGLANTSQVLGGALITIPIAALMAARGRRVGLATAYLIGTLGAGLAILAAVLGNFALLLVGTALFGASSTANSQARYAAVDLAEPGRRGRQLSLVVWATTIGSVLGPNMLGPGKALAGVLGLSAPMLSQLISAQRIKIGNPAVYERLVMLEERRGETDLAAVLQQVQDSDPVLTTGVSRVRPAAEQPPSGSPDDDPRLPATLASQLAMLGTADQLRAVVATARAVQAEDLAGLLQAAADHAAGTPTERS